MTYRDKVEAAFRIEVAKIQLDAIARRNRDFVPAILVETVRRRVVGRWKSTASSIINTAAWEWREDDVIKAYSIINIRSAIAVKYQLVDVINPFIFIKENL